MKVLNTVLVASVAAAILSSGAFAADFSKKSESELIKLSGSVKADEFADYELEVAKRLKKMSEKDMKAFKEKLHAQYDKATENMSVKQWREYRKATHEAMKKRIDSMSKEELKESGLHLLKGGKGGPKACKGDEDCCDKKKK